MTCINATSCPPHIIKVKNISEIIMLFLIVDDNYNRFTIFNYNNVNLMNTGE